MTHFRRDLVIETKPDRTFVTQADQAIERAIRERILATYPDHGLVGEEYGTDDGRRPGPLVHRPDRRHPQLHARHPAVRDPARHRARRRTRRRRHERAGPRRRAGTPGGVGERGPWMPSVRRPGSRAGSSVSRVAVAGRRPGPARLRRRDRCERARARVPGLLRETWRDRGFGDFWGYALVAEGAAEAMIEVGPHSWDLAAPAVIVEEAGGRFTDLRRRALHPQRPRPRDQRPRPRGDPGAARDRLSAAFRRSRRISQRGRRALFASVSSTRVKPAASKVPVNPT